MIKFRLRDGTEITASNDWSCVDRGAYSVSALSRPDQIETAISLGYGSDIDAMTRDHDAFHAILACSLGVAGGSYALRHAAGRKTDPLRATCEEGAVMALQRYCRVLGIDAYGLAQRWKVLA